MQKTLNQLNKEYQYKPDEKMIIHPTHKKWIEAAWEIQNVYGFVHYENISLGKARELTTAIIDKYVNLQNNENKNTKDGLQIGKDKK